MLEKEDDAYLKLFINCIIQGLKQYFLSFKLQDDLSRNL